MILLDTHVLIWLVGGNERLGLNARAMIDREAAADGARVSAISAWEIAMLSKKGRIDLGAGVEAWLREAFSLPGIKEVMLDARVAEATVSLPEPFHADPADRFIVATARAHRWPLLTADRAILTYGAAGQLTVVDAQV